MAEQFDFILKDNDLVIVNGDFLVEESTNDHIADIVLAAKGEFKQHPTIGANLIQLVEDDRSFDSIKQELSTELKRDGLKNIVITGTSLEAANITANYE